jgi:hypothetical protein
MRCSSEVRPIDRALNPMRPGVQLLVWRVSGSALWDDNDIGQPWSAWEMLMKVSHCKLRAKTGRNQPKSSATCNTYVCTYMLYAYPL